nr:PREDICTED: uncharacterized protein LOC103974909 isoform X2 [Musa acuminata subsp. malaccensis]
MLLESWTRDDDIELEVRRCVDRGRSLPASYAPLAYEPWTTGTRGCVEDPQYCNYVYIPQLWKIQVSLFGHYAFEGPSTSTGIKSETLAVLWQNSTCMASVAARGAQNIHSEVMRKLANLRYIEATRCSRSTPTSKALRPQWAVGGAGKGGSATIKKSKAGKAKCWQKGRHLN